MAKQSIQQFSTTPASNTDIAGINVNTGWPPSNVGIAYRTLMAFLADALVPLSLSVTSETAVTLSPAQASAMYAVYTGALTADCTITLPNALFVGNVQNATTGGHNIILTSGAGTTAVIAPGGAWYVYECDGAGNTEVVSSTVQVSPAMLPVVAAATTFLGAAAMNVLPAVANIAALRANASSPPSALWVEGYASGADGGEGVFWYNSVDVTSSDNGGTIIVDAANHRWYRETGGLPYSVKWFGAMVDGTTNDQAACSACSTALIAAGGGKISIPVGGLRLGSTWQIAASSIWLEGAGDEATVIVNGTTNSAAIYFGDGTNTIYNRCACTNMAFAQAAGVTPGAGNAGLFLSYQSNFNLRVVQIFAFPAALYQGMLFDHASQWFMDSVGVQTCLNTGISMNFCSDTYMSKCRSDANGGNGWSIVDSTGYANACSAFNNTGNAWALSSSGTNANTNWFFVNCVGDTSGSYNWSINQLRDSYFTQCWGSTQQSTGVNTFAGGFQLSGSDVDSLTFNECIAVFNNSHGMNIDQASNIKINGGQFGASGGFGNGRSGAGSGINVFSGLAGIYVNDVQCNGNVSYGLDVDGPTGLVVNGGNMQGNTSGAVSGAPNATRVAGVVGFNPVLSAVGTPTVPASGTTITNPTGVDCNVYIVAGTSVDVFVAGTHVLNATPASVYVPASATIMLTYAGAPTWVWMGQ